MAGGRADVFSRLEPLLRALGRPFLVGGPGAGQTAKLCNNLIAGATMAAIAEACAIAEREGIEPGLLYELLTTSTADSRVLRTRFPLPGVDPSHPASRGYEPLFMLDLIAKDLALALELGEATVGAAALASYREAQTEGLGRLDYSAVFRIYFKSASTSLAARRPSEAPPSM
jgi:3-hydroxyisobutyrate dehydrogenase